MGTRRRWIINENLSDGNSVRQVVRRSSTGEVGSSGDGCVKDIRLRWAIDRKYRGTRGKFEKAKENFQTHVVVDGQLYQNVGGEDRGGFEEAVKQQARCLAVAFSWDTVVSSLVGEMDGA